MLDSTTAALFWPGANPAKERQPHVPPLFQTTRAPETELAEQRAWADHVTALADLANGRWARVGASQCSGWRLQANGQEAQQVPRRWNAGCRSRA
ncbi:hypothetical protein E4P41_06460 [Geodermatophilus sp. DF01-2]|uniref:hypothetical protein n=1 Tax=Geodermatophilus sp. DF01-2 TaxID=2559610 RepID=UPI0010738E96|nr:hypothetical protein [Geodermatophilus sp. DF01_2]TFV62719.1 hypothetical protein E4P41_06460 [Geodermatophilus sp. DF01_2]